MRSPTAARTTAILALTAFATGCFTSEPPPTPQAKAVPVEPTTPIDHEPPTIMATGITKSSDRSYQISKALIDEHLKNPDNLSKMARVRPHLDPQGNLNGFRTLGVAQDKLLYQLGIRSGDVIRQINDMPITSMQQAVEAYQVMLDSEEVRVELVRRGNPLTITYTIR